MIARRARRESDVTEADSQSDACTGIVPYGVVGDSSASLEVRSVLKQWLFERQLVVLYVINVQMFRLVERHLGKIRKEGGWQFGVCGPKARDNIPAESQSKC